MSRVGGNAQIKAMKKVAGTLKIDQAQYRELEAFTKFSGDMDPVTALTIDKGQKNTRLLVQPQYSPMPVEKQIAILYCGTHGLLDVYKRQALNGSLTVASVLFNIFMNGLELLVAFIQAYVFTMLSAVFIGLAQEEHTEKAGEKKAVK